MYSERERSWHSQGAAEVYGIFWWLKCSMPVWMEPLTMHPTAQAGTLLWKGLHKSQNKKLVTRQCGPQKCTGEQNNVAQAMFWSQSGEKNWDCPWWVKARQKRQDKRIWPFGYMYWLLIHVTTKRWFGLFSLVWEQTRGRQSDPIGQLCPLELRAHFLLLFLSRASSWGKRAVVFQYCICVLFGKT